MGRNGFNMKIDNVEVYEAGGIKQGVLVDVTALFYDGKIFRCNGEGKQMGRPPIIKNMVDEMKPGQTFTTNDFYKKHPDCRRHPEGFEHGIAELIRENIIIQLGNDEFQKVKK